MVVSISGVASVHDNGEMIELYDAEEDLLGSIVYSSDFSLSFEEDDE